METIQRLIARFRQSGLVILIGFVLILYISLGFFYWQQNNQQATLQTQIDRISPTIARPLPGIQPLLEEWGKVNADLAEVNDERTAIALLVGIAEKSGISINETGKLSIPAPGFGDVTVGGNTFQLISFRGVRVQGTDSNVTAFLTDLDTGITRNTTVLRQVTISYTESPFTDPAKVEAAATELKSIQAAVISLMTDLGLTVLNVTRNAGNATANMSLFPGPAYYLYGMTVYGAAVNYVAVNMTNGTYGVNASGNVTQVTTGYPAVEFRLETIAVIDVNIYTSRAGKK